MPTGKFNSSNVFPDFLVLLRRKQRVVSDHVNPVDLSDRTIFLLLKTS